MNTTEAVLSVRERVRLAAEEAEHERLMPDREIRREGRQYFVYRLHDAAGNVVYVGRSCDVAGRIRRHHAVGKPWIFDVRSVTMLGPFTWDEVVVEERQEIERLEPRGNIALTPRDGRLRSIRQLPKGRRPCPTCGSVAS